jgi:hypothetical protein
MKFVAFVFNHIVAQKFVSGQRSHIAGFTSILGSLCIVANMVASGHFDEVQAGVAWAGFVLGYKILGDAGKKQALIDATNAATAITVTTQTK